MVYLFVCHHRISIEIVSNCYRVDFPLTSLKSALNFCFDNVHQLNEIGEFFDPLFCVQQAIFLWGLSKSPFLPPVKSSHSTKCGNDPFWIWTGHHHYTGLPHRHTTTRNWCQVHGAYIPTGLCGNYCLHSFFLVSCSYGELIIQHWRQ